MFWWSFRCYLGALNHDLAKSYCGIVVYLSDNRAAGSDLQFCLHNRQTGMI